MSPEQQPQNDAEQFAAAVFAEAQTPVAEPPVKVEAEANSEQPSGDAGATEPEKEPAVEQAATEEEPLPPGVQKRIAKEVAEQQRYQREIDKAISNRKLKEKELADLQAGESGAEPVKTEPATGPDGEPVEPELSEFANYGEYDVARKKWRGEHQKWLLDQAKALAKSEILAENSRKQADAELAEAVKKHGPDFHKHLGVLKDNSSQALQVAVSSLEDWAGVAVHLAKNPDQLEALEATFQQSVYRGAAALGALEARLKAPAQIPAKPAQPLPDPPKVVGGAAAANSEADWDPNKGDFATFARGFAKRVGLSKAS